MKGSLSSLFIPGQNQVQVFFERGTNLHLGHGLLALVMEVLLRIKIIYLLSTFKNSDMSEYHLFFRILSEGQLLVFQGIVPYAELLAFCHSEELLTFEEGTADDPGEDQNHTQMDDKSTITTLVHQSEIH